MQLDQTQFRGIENSEKRHRNNALCCSDNEPSNPLMRGRGDGVTLNDRPVGDFHLYV